VLKTTTEIGSGICSSLFSSFFDPTAGGSELT
jgi:hypothetical protein